MKKTKRIAALFLAVLMMALCIPMTAGAQDTGNIGMTVTNEVVLTESLIEMGSSAGVFNAGNQPIDFSDTPGLNGEAKQILQSVLNAIGAPKANEVTIEAIDVDMYAFPNGGKGLQILTFIRNGKNKPVTIKESEIVATKANGDVIATGYFTEIDKEITTIVPGYSKPFLFIFLPEHTQVSSIDFDDYYVDYVVYYEEEKTPFTDINMWAKDSIIWAYEKNLFSGTSADKFSPNASMDRKMLVTVLHRLAGEPKSTIDMPFTDVKSGYYYEAVKWAYENEVVMGVSDDKFGPDQKITREQMATMLVRYEEKINQKTPANQKSLDGFSDKNAVSRWATDAMEWAYGNGIITGKTPTTLAPKGNATRAEVATMLKRYVG